MEVAKESVQFVRLFVLAGKSERKRSWGDKKVVLCISKFETWRCFGLCGRSRTELRGGCEFIYSYVLGSKRSERERGCIIRGIQPAGNLLDFLASYSTWVLFFSSSV